MSQQALARKFRPSKFTDLVGQEHIVTALSNSLKNNRLHHAYLFTGTRGVGKTTIARIIAKAMSCEEGITANPCGICSNCKQISNGTFIDLFEIDAASHTKVDETKEIISKAMYPPSQGRFRIFIIDEVHMLSKHSFNALLKTLEEPPEYVKFILATTNPEKLPDTILSRCLHFHLAALSPTLINKHLAQILDQENISYEPEALNLIASNANGSIRDSLSILEPIITFANGKITSEITTKVLGVIPQSAINKLLSQIVKDERAAALKTIKSITDKTNDIKEIIKQMMSTLHEISIAQVVTDHMSSLNPELQNIAQASTANQIQLFYQIALKGQQDLAFCPSAEQAFEMICIRMLAFKLDTTDPRKKFKIQAVDSDLNKNIQNNGTVKTSTNVTAKVATNHKQDKYVKAESNISYGKDQASGSNEKNSSSKLNLSPDSWEQISNSLNVVGMTKALLKNTSFSSYENDCLVLEINKNQAALFNDTHKRRIETSLKEMFSKSMKVNVNVTSQEIDTPLKKAEHRAITKKQKAKEEMLADDNVQSIMSKFEATLSDVTVKE